MHTIFILVAAMLIQEATCACQGLDSSRCSCTHQDALCTGLTTWRNPSVRMNSVTVVNSYGLNWTNDMFSGATIGHLSLARNRLQIKDLAPHVFRGLKVDSLDLSDNDLEDFPVSLADLNQDDKSLKGLDMSGNNISNALDDDKDTQEILRNIGRHLEKFAFGHESIMSWPTKMLSHFPVLKELNLTKASIDLMPIDAFYGFAGMLKKLSIRNTKLRSVPLAVSNLNFLEEFWFDNNNEVGDSGMNVPMRKEFLQHLGLVSLENDGISTFPVVLGFFANLTKVILDRNNLRYVSDKSAMAVANVTSLSLINSNISRIPGALQDITKLQNLDLSDNNIHSIEREDMRQFVNLKTLRLNNNRVIYISNNAFENLDKLTTIELKDNNLNAIPCAFRSLCLKHPVTLDLSGNKIECACSLKWLYSYMYDTPNNQHSHSTTNLTIKGKCETIDKDISAFLRDDVSSCENNSLCALIDQSTCTA